MTAPRRASIVTLGCERNESDSEELAGRLVEAGWQIETDAVDSDVVLVNTCGFITAAKKESIDAILAMRDIDPARPVVAVGCLAQRYGSELAEELPEAQAVLGFDQYVEIGEVLDRVVAGEAVPSHQPTDRRLLLPVVPIDRSAQHLAVPGHSEHRRRLNSGPIASLKIASGCDRRCAFCAIPLFRGSLLSRPPMDIAAEARWLLGQGARELYLVSENSTSFGKDLPPASLARLLVELDALAGEAQTESGHPIRIRASYLQPAELRPEVIDAIAGLRHVVSYFDLSFQHADERLLRSMRRFGSSDSFLSLIEQIRRRAPEAGIRTNFIVGFPGETESALQELVDFVATAQLDAAGVFAYSDEEGTEAFQLPGKVADDEIRRRVDWLSEVVDDSAAARATARVGQRIDVLIETREGDRCAVGRAAHQGPADGEVRVRTVAPASIGSTLSVRVEASDGVDLRGVEEN